MNESLAEEANVNVEELDRNSHLIRTNLNILDMINQRPKSQAQGLNNSLRRQFEGENHRFRNVQIQQYTQPVKRNKASKVKQALENQSDERKT